MSRITTHILDTTNGKPANGVTIILYGGENDEWTELVRGVTNTDGRIADLVNKDDLFQTAFYKYRNEAGRLC